MDDSSISLRDYLTQRLDAQDRVADQIHTEVRATNGRVRTLEAKVAVLEERTPAIPATPKRDAAAAGVGALAVAAGKWLWEQLAR